jgi:hypothetical protein
LWGFDPGAKRRAVSGDEIRRRADRRFDEALEREGARDPRDFYRGQLSELRERDREGYGRALAYFQERLIPAVAEETGDPLAEWLEYGCLLANLLVEGAAVQIDPTGRSWPYAPPVPRDHLVLHLPTSTREAAVAVGLPATLSAAQRATYDLLVRRKAG